MPRSRSALTALAVLSSAGACAAAIASADTPLPTSPIVDPTPVATPTPTLTPTPTPSDPSTSTFCGGASPDGSFRVAVSADGASTQLSWGIAGYYNGFPDFCYRSPAAWDVLIDDVVVGHVTGYNGGAYTATGLEIGTTHTFKVVPTNNSNILTLSRTVTITPGLVSSPAPVDTGTPTPTPTPQIPPATPEITPAPSPLPPFTVSGSAYLRTKGASGTFGMPPTSATFVYGPSRSGDPSFTGDIPLVTTQGTLKVAGIIPVRASVLLSGGRLAGTVGSSGFTGSTTQAVAITQASVLGITLTKNTCQTTKQVTFPVTSLGAFSPTAGGKLAGQFTLPAFTGCGSLGGSLGVTTAKSALTLTLAPEAPANS